MAQPNWNTATGSLGSYPSLIEIVPIQLSASAVLPAVTITYSILSGSLPSGIAMTEDGLIYGIPNSVPSNTITVFVVRATDNFQNIRDRTFSLTISGVEGPTFTSPSGTLFSQSDSCLLYTSPSPRDRQKSRMPSSA